MYVNVNMREYCYLPANEGTHKFQGFSTDEVYECVSGFISSDQGYSCFHFFRTNDAKDLAFKIKRDFESATNVKMTLVGANLGNLFNPWKSNKREITFQGHNDVFGNNVKFIDSKTASETKDELNNTNGIIYSCYLCKKLEKELSNLFTECQTNMKDDFFLYDIQSINAKLNEWKFQAEEVAGNKSFTPISIKDFVAYQNLARVIQAISAISNIFTQNNTQHFNCSSSKILTFDFKGNCKMHDEIPSIAYHPAVIQKDKIKRIKNKPEFTSLNKQQIISSFKTT